MLEVVGQQSNIGNANVEVPQDGGQSNVAAAAVAVGEQGVNDTTAHASNAEASSGMENVEPVGTGGNNYVAAESDEAESDSSWHSLYEFL